MYMYRFVSEINHETHFINNFQLRNEKAPWKHSLHGKITASILLKQLVSGNERCHNSDAPPLTH